MSKLNLFIPITKIDEENRLVYGRVAAEEIDNSGEACDYQSSKPNFQKWSNDQLEASGGLSKGNLRVMHGPVAAGIFTDLAFDDDNRVIEGCAKVVDDNEWQKCLAGVYTGFSMGGRYEKRWTDTDGVRKYTALPCEVSLVDKPCIKSATFMLAKADGTEEERPFLTKGDFMDYEPTNDEMLARAQTLAKAAGKTDADWLDFQPEAITLLKAEHLAKAAAPVVEPIVAEVVAETVDTEVVAEVAADTVAKADAPVEMTLEQGWKAHDGSFHLKKADAMALNAKLAAGPTLAEQIAEVAALAKGAKDPGDEDDDGALGDDDGDAEIAKADLPAEITFESAVEFLTKADAALFTDEVKAQLAPFVTVEPEALGKADGLVEENELLKADISQLRQQVEEAGPAIAELRKQVENILKTPVPGGPAQTHVVDKTDDRAILGKGADASGEAALMEMLSKLSPDKIADMAFRAAQQNGRQITM